MRAGRKILNLRHDRGISQQELARLCDITPSALSKIEAGINSPRANIIARIADRLGVTMEYLLDESLPYPYKGYTYRQKIIDAGIDPQETMRAEVTREENAFLEALRTCPRTIRDLAFMLPEVTMEMARLMHFLLKNSQNANVLNPGPRFLDDLHQLFGTPAPPGVRRKPRGPASGAGPSGPDPTGRGGSSPARPRARRTTSGRIR